MFKSRIESLSDLVVGFVLSMGAIAPINRSPTGLFDIFYGLFWFAFSFILLINVWLAYNEALSAAKFETMAMIRLNIALLLIVSIEPYLLNLTALDLDESNLQNHFNSSLLGG